MHSVMTGSGERRPSRFLRAVSTAAYALFAAAGVAFLMSPQLPDTFELSGIWMAWFVLVGALLCAAGSALNRWMGEFLGAPLLAVGFTVLGLESWSLSVGAFPWVAWGNLLTLIGLSAMILFRWRTVLGVYRFVHAVAAAERRREAT